MTVHPAIRFWSKVDRGFEGDCWNWAASKNGKGYGIFRMQSRQSMMGAHRACWELTHGAIDDDMHVLHRCDNPACVNPDHLFLGTEEDNAKDKAAKGRSKNGYSGPHAERLRREHSARMKGSNHPHFGKRHSPETEAKRIASLRAGGRGWLHRYRPVVCVETGIVYKTRLEAATAHGLDNSTIGYLCKHGSKSIKCGYHFRNA